jgi:beta-galactosidase
MTKEMHMKDFDLFEEMGVNSLRLAHYPQAHFMFYEADRRGFIVWEEIPFVGGYVSSEAFDDHLRLQLTEMILQNYNHPSIFFWGLYNEITGDFNTILASLNDLAHRLDPSRITTVAAYQEGSFNQIPDAVSWNKYYGWYYGKYDDFARFFDEWHEKYPDARIGVSEYGAGASIAHHIDASLLDSLPFSYTARDDKHKNPMGSWHPEEWQTEFHINHIKMITERDYLWGSYVWNMFDFGSYARNEGDRPGINDKGLVTHDRQTRKDAFFLYKANWNREEPVLHLCSKRYTGLRESAITDIIVFTNQPDVQLYINGTKTGKKMKPDQYATVKWKGIQLQKGDNTIEIRSGKLTDSCIWKVQ